MQYVSRNPLIPTLQNLARFNEVIKTVNYKNLNTALTANNENVKLLNDKDTLNAFLLDIQRIINESNYNTKNAVIADVKDILLNLKVLSNDTNNDSAKQQLQNAFNNISEHVKISNSLLELINNITNDNLSKEYINSIFKTLDKSTIYAKYDQTLSETINSAFSSKKKNSLINKTLNTIILNYRSNIKKTVALKTKLLNSTTVIYSKLRKISTYFKNFLSTSWKAITSSISLVTKKLSSLTRSISTIVLGLFKAIFNFIAYIIKTLMTVTNLLTGFIAKNVVGIISNALSCVWGFLKTQRGIQTITFISGYIYGRYLKGKFKAYISSIGNINGQLTNLIQEKIESIKNKIFYKITNSTIFLQSKAVIENIINDVSSIGGSLKSNLSEGIAILNSYKNFGQCILKNLSEFSPIADFIINNKDTIKTYGKVVSRIAKYGKYALASFSGLTGKGLISGGLAKLGLGFSMAAWPAAAITTGIVGLAMFADAAYDNIVEQASESLATAHAINYMHYDSIVNRSKAHQAVMSEIRNLNANSNEFAASMSNFTESMNKLHDSIKNKKTNFNTAFLGTFNARGLELLPALVEGGMLSMHDKGHDIITSPKHKLLNDSNALKSFITGYNKTAISETDKLISATAYTHIKDIHGIMTSQSNPEIQDLKKQVETDGLFYSLSALPNEGPSGFAPKIKEILFKNNKDIEKLYNEDKSFAAELDKYLKLTYETIKTSSTADATNREEYAKTILNQEYKSLEDTEGTNNESDSSAQQGLTLGQNPFDINFLVGNPIDKSTDTSSPSIFDIASKKVQSVTSSIQQTAKGLMKDIGLDMAKLIDFISFTSTDTEPLPATNLTSTKKTTDSTFNILIKQPEAFIKH